MGARQILMNKSGSVRRVVVYRFRSLVGTGEGCALLGFCVWQVNSLVICCAWEVRVTLQQGEAWLTISMPVAQEVHCNGQCKHVMHSVRKGRRRDYGCSLERFVTGLLSLPIRLLEACPCTGTTKPAKEIDSVSTEMMVTCKARLKWPPSMQQAWTGTKRTSWARSDEDLPPAVCGQRQSTSP